jgi:putative component of membrane protein insertase Oxa1/YidC/SpoIIIJ protein YidD
MLRKSEKNKYLVILILFVSINYLKSQSEYDWQLVKNKSFSIAEFEYKREVKYLFKNKKWYVKYNPVSLFFGGLLYFYQKNISMIIAANCPYEVSCSNFAKECISKYGIFYGIPLAADRLTRCTRLASFDLIRGVDYNSKTNKIYDSPDEYKIKK